MQNRFIAAVAALLFAIAAHAQPAFPTKPITLIVPWPAGGASDLTLRGLAEAAGRILGQPVIVENKPGASGTLGAVAVSNAAPDGYLLTQAPISFFRVPHFEATPFDPIKDITYIVGISGYTFGVVVRADAPWKTWKELVDYAKANPGKLSYGTPGANTSLHITMEELGFRNKIDWLHVPFKGNSPAMTALLGGHVDAVADSTGWAPFVESGKVRLLVTWGEKRTKKWPDTPTLKELGYGIVSNSPYGIAGPKGMDPKLVKTLHDAFKKAAEDPLHTNMLDKYDQDLIYMSTEEYARYARETFASEKAVAQRIKAQAK